MGIHTCTHASHIYFTLEKNVETNIGINKLTLYQTPSRGHIDPINLPGRSTKQGLSQELGQKTCKRARLIRGHN
jgi:anionic cell wall polymer biosynthesis LytR-Cps2A-Psr (LCP) family protein